jgi:phosphoserine phosphatase RsbU/P
LTAAFQWACQNYQQSEEILDYLFDRVHQFIGIGNRNEDDMTLVVLRVTPTTGENHHDS